MEDLMAKVVGALIAIVLGYILIKYLISLWSIVKGDAEQKDLDLFYEHFLFYPRLTPSPSDKMRVMTELTLRARRIDELHQLWQQSVDHSHPKQAVMLNRKLYAIAHRAFIQALQVARRHGYAQPYLTSYRQLISRDCQYVPPQSAQLVNHHFAVHLN